MFAQVRDFITHTHTHTHTHTQSLLKTDTLYIIYARARMRGRMFPCVRACYVWFGGGGCMLPWRINEMM